MHVWCILKRNNRNTQSKYEAMVNFEARSKKDDFDNDIINLHFRTA